MGWSIGYDNNWKRDIGYGVPSICDHPKCNNEIDRGLSYVCGSELYGEDFGCGLYFCGEHLMYRKLRYSKMLIRICPRCYKYRKPYDPKPDTNEWLEWKLKDSSWKEWRKNNPDEVKIIKKNLSPEFLGEEKGGEV